MVSGGMKCVKYLLFAFNFVIVFAGLALIVVGALVQTKFNDYLSFFNGTANAAAIFIIAVGVITFVIGFFGCCGAFKENHCMIVTFIVLLCIVLVLEIAAAIVAFVLRNKLATIIADEMRNATINYNGTTHKGVTKAWDKVQKEFQCCGAGNYSDWINNEALKDRRSVPDSCCLVITEGCGKGQLDNPNKINTKGCVKGFIDWVQKNIVSVGSAAAALTVVEIIGIIIASCLASAIRREYEVV